eukprot:3751223-Pyramimonas_sp.AAC.1
MHCLSKLLHRDCWRLGRLRRPLALMLPPGSVDCGDDRFVQERADCERVVHYLHLELFGLVHLGVGGLDPEVWDEAPHVQT